MKDEDARHVRHFFLSLNIYTRKLEGSLFNRDVQNAKMPEYDVINYSLSFSPSLSWSHFRDALFPFLKLLVHCTVPPVAYSLLWVLKNKLSSRDSIEESRLFLESYFVMQNLS